MTSTSAGTPSFCWINLEFLFPVFHAEKYMAEDGPIRGSVNQPFSWAVLQHRIYNLFCRSRRRQGKIYTT